MKRTHFRLVGIFARLPNVLVSVQNPLILDRGSEPQPDLMVLKWRADSYTGFHPRPEDVLLLIEVADSTIRNDREFKLPLYALNRIQEYWIVNVAAKQLEMYRQPNVDRYEHASIPDPDAVGSAIGIADFSIKVRELFPV